MGDKVKSIIVSIMLIFIVAFISGCSSSVETKSKESIIHDKTFHSKILDGNLNLKIYIPQVYSSNEKLPVLYFLHGASGNPDTLFDSLDIKNCADRLIANKRIKPLIIVSTDTLNPLRLEEPNKTQSINENPFEGYICKELIPFIDSNYNTITSKDGRFIGGISMGGFAAIQTAVHHPDIFSKAGGHSPASWLVEYSDKEIDNWLYSARQLKKGEDISSLPEETGLADIRIYLDCGKDDSIVNDVEKLFPAFKKRGIKVECHVNDGDHAIDYWKRNLERYLIFYSGS
ncbi:MAG TPA: alpha/beta hydrolase-fold protein [Clostridia bacterium]